MNSITDIVLNKLREAMSFIFPVLSNKIETLPSNIPDRMIEYPFVLRELYLEKGRILDVGCTSPYNILPLILADQGFDVYGMDLREFKIRHPNFTFVKGSIEKNRFPSSYFDGIIAVSTIEHIGLKGRYTAEQDTTGDRKAILEMIRIMKEDGIILLTVPFGKAKISGSSHRIYDSVKLRQLILGLNIVKKEFYFKNKSGFWGSCEESTAELIEESSTQEYALACLVLSKTAG